MSVGSSDDENEEQKNISKYFDYLNEDDFSGSSQRKKKKKGATGKENTNRDTRALEDNNKSSVKDKNAKNKSTDKNERASRKGEHEKDIRHIERHLSMKKTIRKKMMRDLQQAFVEDPKDLQQDPKGLAEDKKNNIDINNLTFSKNRISKSEHNFLDMLKEDQVKERKGLRALIDFRKDKTSAQASSETDDKNHGKTAESKSTKDSKSSSNDKKQFSHNDPKASDGKLSDEDSGHESPTREPGEHFDKRSKSRDDLMEDCKDGNAGAKKQSFWKRFTGKNKTRR